MRLFLKQKQLSYKLAKITSGQVFCYKTKKQLILEAINQENTMRETQLGEAGQSVAKQKSKKKKILNAVFFAVNIVVVAFILIYQLKQETVMPISELLAKGVKFINIPIIIICFLVVMLSDTLRTNLLIIKSKNRSRPYLSFKTCAIGKYYDALTPLSTGGQPFQVFYLSNRGLSASTAISVPMARYAISQIAWNLVSLVAVICFIVFNFAGTTAISVASFVGFGLNFLVLVIMLVVSLSKRVGQTLVVKTLKALKKFKIIKNYDKRYEVVMKVVNGYQTTMKEYAKSKLFFLFEIFLSIVNIVVNFTIPYFIYRFLGGRGVLIWPQIACLAIMIELAASFIPLPGGTGMNEISFTIIFASVFPEGTLFWALLIWRFMSYYIYLLQGIGVVIYDYFRGNKKYTWLKRKWELEAESIIFKEQQIKSHKTYKRSKKNKIQL